jgi:hypothetical protein
LFLKNCFFSFEEETFFTEGWFRNAIAFSTLLDGGEEEGEVEEGGGGGALIIGGVMVSLFVVSRRRRLQFLFFSNSKEAKRTSLGSHQSAKP